MRARLTGLIQFARQHPFLVAYLAFGTFLVLRTGFRTRGVIIDHLEFGRRLFAGEDLYAEYRDAGRPLHPVYPPSFGLMTWPFSLLGERLARFAWGGLQVAALVAISRVLLERLVGFWPRLSTTQPNGQRFGCRAHWTLLITILLGSRYILRDTHGGGGNLINAALVLLCLRDAERGRGWRAGLWLGVSLATKPVTALMLPVLAMFAHGRAFFASLLFASAFLLLSFAAHGFDSAPFERWFRGSASLGSQVDVFQVPDYGFPPFAWMNQSLRFATARFLGTTPEQFAAQVPGFRQGLGMDAATVNLIATMFALSLFSLVLVRARQGRKSSEGRLRAVATAMAVSVLVSPISWKAHHVALLPAFFLLARDCVRGSKPARVFAVVYYFTCVAGGGDLVGRAGKYWQQAHYLATFGALAFVIWLGRGPQVAASVDDLDRD